MKEREVSGYRNEPKEEVQDLYLKLIELNSFNWFCGPEVAEDLRRHRDLWKAVSMEPYRHRLLYLRDMAEGAWNVDTLVILSSQEDDKRLELLAKTWDADEVTWIEGRKADQLLGWGESKQRILRVWWD